MRASPLATVVERCLPFDAERLFDVAADIEHYPEFVPGWVAVRVQARRPGYCRVENTVALGPLQLRFTAEAHMDRPRRIDVASDQPPFERFMLSWVFEPLAGGCRVRLRADLDLNSGLLKPLIEQAVRSVASDVIRAFEERAHELCGAATRDTA